MAMTINRKSLAREALDASLDYRGRANCELGTPINVFDLCAALNPQVRLLFTDYSMEGCYLRSDRPLIKVSALRPIGRRAFNCAHELGHHAFGHGSRIDELQNDDSQGSPSDPEEFLANAFAGFLLMPKIAVRGAFTRRGWKIGDAGPEQIFTVACHFGVGYETLVSHLAFDLEEIPRHRAEALRKIRLPAIRRSILDSISTERLCVVDKHFAMSCLDTEVGTHLLLPEGSVSERSSVAAPATDTAGGRLFLAQSPGLSRVEAPGNWAVMVRVSKYQYSGWSQYRHLEAEDDDE